MRWMGVGAGAEDVACRAGEAGVETANDGAVVAKQFGLEGGGGDAQVGFFDEVVAEPRVAVHPVDDAGSGVGVEGAAREQRGGVVGEGPLFDLGHEGLEVGGLGLEARRDSGP